MKVDYVDHMGSDLSVVNAARVSFDKISTWNNDGFSIASETYGTPLGNLNEKDTKLIAYLARNNHWSPFGHTSVSMRISAPIFVARQLVKHQVGLVWNEVSRRYVDAEPTLYTPNEWRSRPTDKKQGSGDVPLGPLTQGTCGELYNTAIEECLATYNDLLKAGVAPEQARIVLPVSTYTEWIWTGSLYAFARVCHLRMKPDAQEETRVIAEQIYKIMEGLFPVSWKALCGKLVENEQSTTV